METTSNRASDAAVGPLRRSAALLRLLAAAGHRGAALSSLAQTTGMAPSTVHRLLAQMIEERMALQLEDNKRYAVGPLIYEVGLAAKNQFDVRGLCRPILEELAATVSESTYLIQRSGEEAVCTDLVEGRTAERVLMLQIGSRRPLGLGAGGASILAALDVDEADFLLPRLSIRMALENELRDDSLDALVRQTRESGYSIIRNRVTRGVTAVGISFADSLGQPFGAITVAAVNARMTAQKTHFIVGRLKQSKRALEEKIRGNRWVRYVQSS